MKARMVNEDFKSVLNRFIADGNVAELVKASLAHFKDLKNKNILIGNDRDIDYVAKGKNFLQFNKFLDEVENKKIFSRLDKHEVENVIVLSDTDTFLILIPLSMDASKFYGKGSKWCTARKESERNRFNLYFAEENSVLIYVIDKKKNKKIAIRILHDNASDVEFTPQENEFDITEIEFNDITKLNAKNIISSALGHLTEIQAARHAILSNKSNIS